MEYKNIDSQHILVRLDPNDEIVTSLMQVAKEENIGLAMVQGLRRGQESRHGRLQRT